MTLIEDAAYLALKARDARFDGRLFVGVTSTRIYCRPVCRVRTPLRKNCRFYANAASAEHAGFRPCLRCRPELAPGLSLVDSPQVLAHHAARMLDHAVRVGQPMRVPELAARLGVTDRHLRRVFAQVHGVTPIGYLTTQRLLLAKQLLTDTALPVTQVALSCGFESLRRFNAVFAQRCRLSPSRLRRDSASAPAAPAGPRSTAVDGLTVRIGYRPPYDIEGSLRFLTDRALAGIEVVDGLAVRRTMRLGLGAQAASGWLALRFDAGANEVRVLVSPSLVGRLGQVLEAVRHAFDLDADPLQIDAVLRALPVPPRPGVRVLAGPCGFETATRVILGQQVSVAAARTLTRRLVERFGEPLQTPWPELNRLFPSAEVIAAADPDEIGRLGIVRQRVAALQALAAAVHEGRIALHRGAPLQATLAALRALPGIGEWTVQLIAMRALAWPDAFPASDIGVLNALGTRVLADVQRMSLAWRPWRAYAVMRLWQTLEKP